MAQMRGDLTNIALINVVFLLMVFFLLVGSRHLPLTPPKMDGSLSEAVPAKGVVITLSAKGEVSCNRGELQLCFRGRGAVNIQADGKATAADFYALMEGFQQAQNATAAQGTSQVALPPSQTLPQAQDQAASQTTRQAPNQSPRQTSSQVATASPTQTSKLYLTVRSK